MSDIRNDVKRHKISLFRLFMYLYTAVFIAALMFGVSLLNDFLTVYERSRPVHAIDEYMLGVTDSFYQITVKNSIDIETLEFENEDSVRETIEKSCAEPHIYSYRKKSDEYTDEKPVYLILADDKAFLKVTFSPESVRDKYDFPVWSLSSAEPLINLEYKPEHSVKALVPEYATLLINGTEVSDSYISNAHVAVPQLEPISKYLDKMPEMKEYTVSGLYDEPMVSACGKSGAELDSSLENGEYTFDFERSVELEKELTDYVVGMEKAYISFMINENRAGSDNFAALGKYMLSGTSIYRQISSCSVSSNNPFDSREDKLISAENFRSYSDECFSCDMVFNVKLNQRFFSKEFTGNLRWYFVKSEDKWLAVDMTLIK